MKGRLTFLLLLLFCLTVSKAHNFHPDYLSRRRQQQEEPPKLQYFTAVDGLDTYGKRYRQANSDTYTSVNVFPVYQSQSATAAAAAAVATANVGLDALAGYQTPSQPVGNPFTTKSPTQLWFSNVADSSATQSRLPIYKQSTSAVTTARPITKQSSSTFKAEFPENVLLITTVSIDQTTKGQKTTSEAKEDEFSKTSSSTFTTTPATTFSFTSTEPQPQTRPSQQTQLPLTSTLRPSPSPPPTTTLVQPTLSPLVPLTQSPFTPVTQPPPPPVPGTTTQAPPVTKPPTESPFTPVTQTTIRSPFTPVTQPPPPPAPVQTTPLPFTPVTEPPPPPPLEITSSSPFTPVTQPQTQSPFTPVTIPSPFTRVTQPPPPPLSQTTISSPFTPVTQPSSQSQFTPVTQAPPAPIPLPTEIPFIIQTRRPALPPGFQFAPVLPQLAPTGTGPGPNGGAAPTAPDQNSVGAPQGRNSPNRKQVFRTISLHVSITFFLCFPKLEGI
jgi:hypothetical protein